jgi:catechol-2,3-dioxygenase
MTKLKANRVILFVKDVPAMAAFYSGKLGLQVKEASRDKKWADLDAGGLMLGLHSGGKSAKAARAPKIVF